MYVLSKNWCLENLFEPRFVKHCHVIAELWQKNKHWAYSCPYFRNSPSLLKKEEKMKKNQSILFELGAQTFFWKWETHYKGKPLLPSCKSHTSNKVHTKYQTFFKSDLWPKHTPYLSVLDWKIKFEKSSSTNWIFNLQKLISKLIFAGYTGSKNPVRNRPKIQFVELDFSNLIYQKSSIDG